MQQATQFKRLNPVRYSKLLAEAAPRVIRSNKELDHFTSVLTKLEQLQDCSREEFELAELLAALIDMRKSVMPICKPIDGKYASSC